MRFAAALCIVALAMAVSCPEPEPEPDPTPPVETKSYERKQLESAFVEGLYMRGSCVLAYDASTFQLAVNSVRKNYRIQRDDQSCYLNILYIGTVPSAVDAECECEIHYRLSAGEATTLFVKFTVVKMTEEYVWLWNEFQKVGVIARRL